MMALYFDKKYIIYYSVPVANIALICAIFFPFVIDGANYDRVDAFTKVLLLTLLLLFYSKLLTEVVSFFPRVKKQSRQLTAIHMQPMI